MKDFVAINFSEYLKSISEEQNREKKEKLKRRKVAKSFYISLTTHDDVQSNFSDNGINHYHVEILNLFDPEL